MMSAQPELRTVRISDIIFDRTIYPPSDHDPALVGRYAETIPLSLTVQ